MSERSARGPKHRRLLFVTHGCYLDDSNGAAVASRTLVEALARRGWTTAVVSGMMLDLDQEVDTAQWLAERGLDFATCDEGPAGGTAPHFRLAVNGVPVFLHRSPTTRLHDADDAEREEFLRLYQSVLARLRPDVVVSYGGNRLACEVRAIARARGCAVVFPLHNFHYHHPAAFAHADAVLVASRFSADYHREALGLDCHMLPYLVDRERAVAETREPKYVTFVNPSFEKGVYAFARIADELGRRRPDIPLLVVESRGTEATLAGCGLDLRARGNVRFMAHTADPRKFWRVTRLCLIPSLFRENQALTAVEALLNGIPVIASNRGGLPETLGSTGIALPLPDRLTSATRELPTAEEVAPWVEAVIRLWDDASLYQDHRRRALAEAARWSSDDLEPRYAEFFETLVPGRTAAIVKPEARSKAVVLVPHLNGIDWECEQGLRALEEAGVKVVRRGGSSAIDLARNELASDALQDGFEAIMFIDSDLAFDPLDALRLLARPEPVLAGVYAKKGRRGLASALADGIDEVVFGAGAFGLYPLKYAATGFLRIRASVLRRLIEELPLPRCNERWGRGFWPFFLPLIIPDEGGGTHYLGEDWAFSHRLRQIGVTPLADTSVRLWHWGRHPFGWEDAGLDRTRFATFRYRIGAQEVSGFSR